MKLETNQDGTIVLKEVFSGILMETGEGNRVGICMRDDTFEINVIPKGEQVGRWHRVDMQRVEIGPLLKLNPCKKCRAESQVATKCCKDMWAVCCDGCGSEVTSLSRGAAELAWHHANQTETETDSCGS
jgi:hypothetical protein